MNIDVEETRRVIGKLIEEKEKFSEFMSKSFQEFGGMEEKKKETQNILQSFICTKGGYILVDREQSGDRVVITKSGMKKILYRHQRGVPLDNSEIFSLLMKLRGNSMASKRMMKNPQVKLRIQCYVKALQYMEEFYVAWEEYMKVKELRVGEFSEPKTMKGEYGKDKAFHYFRIGGSNISFYGKSDVGANPIRKILDDKCFSAFSIDYDTEDTEEMLIFVENYPKIKESMDKLNAKFPIVKKKMLEAIAKVMKELAPVLTLEAIALD